MSAKKKKTILRTIRLSEGIDNMLEKDAQEQNISANALISKIMVRYVEWDRIVQKINNIAVSGMFFKALLNEVSNEKIEEIGRSYAIQTIKDLAMWEFGKTDFDTLLKTIFLVCKYGLNVRINAPSFGESKVDNTYIITVYHDWGPKGSVLFKSYFDQVIKNELGKQPAISVTDDVVTVNFKLPKSVL